jgi:hypothetical protein
MESMKKREYYENETIMDENARTHVHTDAHTDAHTPLWNTDIAGRSSSDAFHIKLNDRLFEVEVASFCGEPWPLRDYRYDSFTDFLKYEINENQDDECRALWGLEIHI